MRRVLADLDFSPPPSTLISANPSTSSNATEAALAWGSDEEDLLNVEDPAEETHFDAAIKSVASTERLLRSELGREEASLRQLGNSTTTNSSCGNQISQISPSASSSTIHTVCYVCAAEESSRRRKCLQRSIAVDTDGLGCSGDFALGTENGDELLAAGKARIPGRGVQMHEKLLGRNRGR